MGIFIISLKQNKGFFTHPKRILFFVISSFVLTSFFMIEMKDAFAVAGVNETINFQGRVANTDGTNVADGNYNFVFRLYKASSGGSAQWTETWNSGTSQVEVTNGIFKVALGTHASLSSLDFNDDSWYLSVEFNGDGEMSPRIQFASVPYALNAKKVSGLTVTNTTGTFTLANGKTFAVNNGLTFSGTDSTTFTFPSTSGTVATLDAAQVLTNKTIGSTGLVFNGATTDITTVSNEDFVLSPNGTGRIGFGTSTLVSGAKVTVNGALSTSSILLPDTNYSLYKTGTTLIFGNAVDQSLVSSASNADLLSNSYYLSGSFYRFNNAPASRISADNGAIKFYSVGAGTGPITWTGNEKFVIDTSGNVGIGTASPLAKLDVVGSASISGQLALYTTPQIQSTKNQTLTLGGNTTGNINIRPKDGLGSVIVNSSAFEVYSASGFGSASNYTSISTGGDLSFVGTADYLIPSGGKYAFRYSGDEDYGLFFDDSAGSYDFRNGTASNVFRVNASTGALTSSAYTTNGGLIYSTSGGVFTQLGAGTTGQCLTSNTGAAPSWGTCPGAGSTSSRWVLNASDGTLSPINNKLDFLVGGTATSSAKFAVLGVASDSPIASLSASTGFGFSFGYDGTIQTTKNQTLTLGGNSTGNIILSPLNGAGTVTVNGTLDASTGGGATFLVAANDSPARMKAQADYVADGTADEVQIQSAIDALPSTGGQIQLAQGTYNLADTASITANKRVRILGYGATLRPAANVAAITVNQGISNARGVVIEGVLIDGQDNTGTTGILLEDTNNPAIYNVRITDVTTGIHINSEDTNEFVEGVAIEDVLIRDCTAGGTGISMTTNDGTGSFAQHQWRTVKIANCDTGINLAYPSQFYRSYIENATIWVGDNQNGIVLDGDVLLSRMEINVEASTGSTGHTAITIGPNATNTEHLDFYYTQTGTVDTILSNTSSKYFTYKKNRNWFASGGNPLLQFYVHGDTQERLGVRTGFAGGGGLVFGPGASTVPDTNLYRAGASTLKTDGSFTVGSNLIIEFPGGSPSVNTSSEGMQSASVGNLDLHARGSYRIFTDSNNNSSDNLRIFGDGTSKELLRLEESGQKALLSINNYWVSQDIFTASASGATKLRLDSTGNLGLGVLGADTIEGQIHVRGINDGSDAVLVLDADRGDDNSDKWSLISQASDNDLSFANHTSEVFKLSSAGSIYLAGGQVLDTLSNNTLGIGTTNATTITIGRALQGITLPGFDCSALSNGGKLTTTSGGILTCANDTTGGGGGSNWVLNAGLGILSPINNTLDFLIGGTATNSAKFAVLNIADGTPVASVSSGVDGFGTYFDANGNIQTTRNKTLTLGGSTTGNILLFPQNGSGRVGINTSEPGNTLGLDVDDNYGIELHNTVKDFSVSFNTVSSGSSGTGVGVFESPGGDGNYRYIFEFTDTGEGADVFKIGKYQHWTELRSSFWVEGKVEITGTEHANGATGKSSLIVNQPEAQDIFTASASSATRFKISNNGDLAMYDDADITDYFTISNDSTNTTLTRVTNGSTIGNVTINSSGTLTAPNLAGSSLTIDMFMTNGGLLYTDGSGLFAQLGTGDTGECLLGVTGNAPSWGSCPGGSGGSSNWILNSTDGTLSPINNTLDFLLGGTATNSAKFAVLNIADGTPVASVSSGVDGFGTYFDANGNIQTTRNKTLTLGGNTTGNIQFKPGDSSNSLYLGSNGNVGIGAAASSNYDIEIQRSNGTVDQSFFLADDPGTAGAFASIDFSSLTTTTDSWSAVFTHGPGVDMRTLFFDAANNVMYAGSGTNGYIYRCETSTLCDASGDWAISYDTVDATILTFTMDTTNNVIYAGTGSNGRLYRCATSTGCDASGDWTVGLDVTDSYIYSAAFDTANGILYVGTFESGGNADIYRCDIASACDASGDWTAVYTYPTTSVGIISLEYDSANGVIYAGTANTSVLRCATSTGCDASGEWTEISPVGSASVIYDFSIDSANGVIYAATTNSGTIYRCVLSTGCDASGEWTTAYDSSATTIYSLAYDSTNGIMYAGSGANGLIFSCATSTGCDASGDWSTEYDATAAYIYGLAFDSANSVLYAGTYNAEILRHTEANTGSRAIYTKIQTLALDTANGAHSGALIFNTAISGGSSEVMRLANGMVGINTNSPTSSLYVTRPLSLPVTGKALAIFDQIEDQDIFTASASGTPKFTITRAGGLRLGTSEGSSGQCLQSGGAGNAIVWGSCGAQQTPWTSNIDADNFSLLDLGTNITARNGLTLGTGSSGNLTLTPNGSGDVIVSGDGDTNFRVNFSAPPTDDMVVISNSGQGTTTTGVTGLYIDFTQSDDGDNTDFNAGLMVDVTSSSGDADGLVGIMVGSITGGNAFEAALAIGEGWDAGLTISSGGATNSGLVYSGAGRPTKTITLSPEYPGAVLTDYYGAGTDTNITGAMTSDTDTTQGTSIRNYYEWERTVDSTQHFYTVAVRVTLPADFDDWASSNAVRVSYITESGTNTVSDLDVRIYNENDAAIVASDVDNASTSWTTVDFAGGTLNDNSSSEWDAAGETAVIYLRMGSASSNYVRVGDIQLNYLAKF